MNRLIEKIEESLNEQLVKMTISNPRKAEEIKKYSIRPVLLKDVVVFQMERYTKTQVFHENLDRQQTMDKLKGILPLYKQVQMKTMTEEITVLINKKGKASIRTSGRKKEAVRITPERNHTKTTEKIIAEHGDAAWDLSRLRHNRKKNYILEEGKAVPFLVDLGVMTAEGKIVRTRYDKYRQINRFLEFIEDVLPYLSKDREITILDFGCGKSYLTFAMYYYLRQLQGYDVRIIGLDLKKDVIKKCSLLAQKYGYDKLKFYEGSIEEFEGVHHVDMVVTLHACDTATDYALYKAVRWKADVILSVPCCQHELNRQLKGNSLSPITDYGILKERFAAMATDAIRGALLEGTGYETQILEFIEMEHTPKNLLIRAVKGRRPSAQKWEKALRFCEQFGLKPTLQTLLEEERGR